MHRQNRWRLWIPVGVYSTAIFIQSSFTMSGALPPINHIDLAAHAAVYSLLGLLVARAIAGGHGQLTQWSLWLLAAGLTAAYGVSDEIHQAFVPGRQCDRWDMVADAVGGGLGAGAWLGIIKIRSAKTLPFPR